ncbi:uncharacterized protein LOC128244049 [Mya arenaria]|uniref:uncharacterized protein LOC128244049 n=1 Tax=Mya arenaria TaxID=6604 RepID=UPI0022E58C29|nr:uncharacterized protein LOC128244049 [Mya arenaria]
MAECQDTSELGGKEDKEEDTELFCEQCLDEGTSIKAKGYCLDCNDYLCETCLNVHCLTRPMRKHRLCRTDEVPKRDEQRENNPNDATSDNTSLVCQIHDGYVIVSYCGTHNQLCCEKCLNIGHVACKDLNNITEFKNEITSKKEFNSFCASMTHFKNKWQIEKQRAFSYLDDVNRCYETTISFVTNQLGEMKAADSAYLGSVIAACESTINQLDQWLSDVESFKTSKQNNKLLQFMHSTQSQLRVMDDYVHASFGKSQITRYCIGNVEPSETSIINIAKTPFLLKRLNVKTLNKSKVPKIRDIICLNKTHMLVIDEHQNNIRLIDTTEDKVISRQTIDGLPLQMSRGEHTDVYVLHLDGQINVVQLQEQDNKFGLKDKIRTGTKYHTVDYYNQKLKVIGGNPIKLTELTLDRKVDRIVSESLSQTKDANGQSLISSVSFSTVEKSNGSVFVPGNNSIVEIKNDGTVELFAYSELLQSPQNIRVLEDSLLVSSLMNKNVYRVYRSSHVSSVFPKPLDFPVVAIGYDSEERRLFVGGESEYVHVYQL